MPDVSLKEYVDRRFDEQEKAVKAALASSEKAADINRGDVQKWRDNANEWRGAMGDRERDFLTRKEFYAMVATGIAVVGFFLAFKH